MTIFQSARGLAVHIAVGLALLTLAHLFFERLPSVRGDVTSAVGGIANAPAPDPHPWVYGNPPTQAEEASHPYDRL